MPILLVRHADAGGRFDWPGDDRQRPLSAKGRDQAARLADELAPLHPTRVLSSPFWRCTETVEPLAERLHLPVEATEELAEGHTPLALRLVRSLAGQTAVAVSHGDVIPELLWALADHDGMALRSRLAWAKASTWVLEARDGRFVCACYREPPGIG